MSENIPLPLNPVQPKKPGALSAKAEALNLLHAGTKVFCMTPAMIIQTAKQDLASHQHNVRVTAERKVEKTKDDPHPELVDPVRPYGFIAKHIRGQTTPAGVLQAAISDIAHGIGSQNPNTARLYADVDLLNQALDILVGVHTPP